MASLGSRLGITVLTMAECYCGCGRKIGALATGRKSANKMGRLVTETLTSLKNDVRPEVMANTEPKTKPFRDRVDETIQHGEWFEQDCRRVVHEESNFGDVPWPAMREWVRDAQGMASFFRLPPEQRAQIASQG